MTVRVPTESGSEVWTIDFRETAPGLASPTMYLKDPSASMFGGLAVGVPGELRGLEEAHNRWGSLPWKRLVTPSVELARGWPVSKELAKRIAVCLSNCSCSLILIFALKFEIFRPLMLGEPDWSAIFAPQGRLLKEGEIIRRTNLSRTLATIAEEGVDAFYSVDIFGFESFRLY
jgi:gamma-glutamyltranspeptidase/glutathione hydrolase/leukotriene-C4 hydrolase